MSSSINLLPVGAVHGIPISTSSKITNSCIVTVKPMTVAQQVQSSRGVKRSLSDSDEEPEILRCKRRIDFSKYGYNLPKAQPQAVARRNERERNRVKQVNLGFATLREHVPSGNKSKKMSKVDTLKSAVDYIKYLTQLLDEHDAVAAAFDSGLSPSGSEVLSPTPSFTSESSYEHLSAEEEELLDFANWFHWIQIQVRPTWILKVSSTFQIYISTIL